MTTVKTKDGEMPVHGSAPDELLGPAAQPKRANKVAGEVVLVSPSGREIRLNPTFEAALEIEDELGGLDNLRLRAAAGGHPGFASLTLKDKGVIIAAGVRATGEERVTAENCARFAWTCGNDALRKPLSDFLRALVDGGKVREDDLKNAASSNGSTRESEVIASEMFEDLTAATHSDATSA